MANACTAPNDDAAPEKKKRRVHEYTHNDEVSSGLISNEGPKQRPSQELDEKLDEAHTSAAAPSEGRVATSNTPSYATNTKTATTTTVYIGGVPNQYCTESVVEKIMSRYGTIVRCSVVQKADRPHKFCFCEFSTVAQANAAVQGAHGRLLGGQRLMVQPASSSRHESTQQALPSTPPVVNAKRQAQQINLRIDAIQRKLAAKAAKR